MAYGASLFVVHDIFIHQRFKYLETLIIGMLEAVRRAHKIHHKHLGKDEGECLECYLFRSNILNDSS